MTFERPEIAGIEPGEQERATALPFSWVVLVATVLITVGQTLQQ